MKITHNKQPETPRIPVAVIGTGGQGIFFKGVTGDNAFYLTQAGKVVPAGAAFSRLPDGVRIPLYEGDSITITF